MRILLTSWSVCGTRVDGVKVDATLSEENDFINNVKKNIKGCGVFTYLTSDPEDFEGNDNSLKLNARAFEKVGITFLDKVVVDSRFRGDLKDVLNRSSIIYLQGGDVVVQNKFFDSIGLRDAIQNVDALIIGQSAGSMNLSKRIYIYPEDNTQLNYPKFMDGLGLTDIAIIPHYNVDTGNSILGDGINLIDDYFIPDSSICVLYALIDGSYIEVIDNKYKIFGECYKIVNGKITCVCNKDCSIEL